MIPVMPHRWISLMLAVAVALSSCATALALDPRKALTQYSHDNWQSNRGLPQNAVNAIAQGPEGYLWCATQEGLVRFDGVQFTVFDKWNTPALTNNNIRALCFDRAGALWIGTNGGGLVRMKDGVFETFTTSQGLVYDNVNSLCPTADGSLWAGTYGGGLSRFKDGRFTNFTTRDGLAHDSVLALFEDPDGSLWVGTNGGGVCRYEEGRFSRPAWARSISHETVYAIRRTRDGALWVGTYGGGIYRVVDGKMTHLTTKEGLSNDRVLSLYEDKDGALWVGTFGGGISRHYDGRWDSISSAQGLPYDVVRAFAEDREGNLWIGLDGGGLLRLHDGSFKAYSVQEGLSNDFAIGITQTRDGDVWVTTNGGGINRIHDGKITSLTTREGLPNDLVRSIYEDASGSLWIGTDGGGLAVVERSGRVKVMDTRKGLSSNRVIAIMGDSKGNIWVGTNGGGLDLIRDGVVTVMPQRPGRAAMVNLIHEDRLGRLWVGTYGGGLSLLEGNTFTSFPGQDEIGSAIVTHIHEDADGTLWLGTIGSGLIRLRGGHVVKYTRRDGLFDDVAYEVLDDGLGHLWMSGNTGVYRVARASLEAFADGRAQSIPCESYGEADGMKSAECNGGFTPSGYRTADGQLWFPTMRGVAVVDPAHLGLNKLPPPVRVERVILNGKPLDAAAPVVVPPGRNSLEIHYTGLSFVAPARVRFKYQLTGYDPSWVDAGVRRTAYYTDIPPGRYDFKVVACNNDGRWNDVGASISVVKRPRLYQTAWFWALCAAAVVLLGPGLYWVRVRRLQARQRELEALVGERTSALQEAYLKLEQANGRLEALSSQDPLTGVANRRVFDDVLEREWRRAQRSGQPLSLLMVDIDSFKAYNDAYGHKQGDECLRQVATALSSTANRAGDLVSRYGGEEFVVVLPATSSSGAKAMAESLRMKVEALGIPHEASATAPFVTISVGVGTGVPQEDSPSSYVLERADRALYLAKQEGRNRVRSLA
jgi:diguanylate cyclase (GGDEF)-like protein